MRKTLYSKELLLNISSSILVVMVFFGILELYARYRFFEGTKLADVGFATREGHTPLKKTTPLRIVCIGGSTTYGYYVASNESYPAYLEKILNEKFNKRVVEVQNSGIPKVDSLFFKEYVRKRISQQQLDILIVDCVYNDFGAFFPFFYNPTTNVLTADYRWRTIGVKYNWENFNFFERINIFLNEHSYFYVRFRERLLKSIHRGKTLGQIYQMRASEAGKKSKERKPFIEGIPDIKYYDMSTKDNKNDVINSFFRRFREDIESIIIDAKAHNVDVVLVIPPYPLMKYSVWKSTKTDQNISDDLFKEVFYSAKNILTELSVKYNLLFIDNDNELNKRGRNEIYFYDAIHLSPQGNHVIAEILAEKLQPYLKKVSTK